MMENNITISQDEFENFVRDQHSMEILTEYRQRGLRPDDALLDVLCGISRDENFASIPTAVKRQAKVIRELECKQED